MRNRDLGLTRRGKVGAALLTFSAPSTRVKGHENT